MDINTEKGQCACGCLCDCSAEEQEKYAKIANVIDLYKGKQGCLIQVLHAAQNIYGYLPYELQKFIADSLDMPVSEVSGVVTFYSFFSTKEANTPCVSAWVLLAMSEAVKSWLMLWKKCWVSQSAKPLPTRYSPLRSPVASALAVWLRQ